MLLVVFALDFLLLAGDLDACRVRGCSGDDRGDCFGELTTTGENDESVRLLMYFSS